MNEYALQVIYFIVDLVVTFLLYSRIKKNTKNFELFKFKKMILTFVFLIVASVHFNLFGVAIISGVILGIYPIITLIAYPDTFRMFLEDYNNRTVSKQNLSRLISDESIEQVVDFIIDSYGKKVGSTVVITRKDLLTDVEHSGYSLGETTIMQYLMEGIFKQNSKLNQGALVIRDNKIVAVNCKLPIVFNEQMQRAGAGNRHFGMLGITSTTDAVVIGTSGDTGRITIGGTKPDGKHYLRLMARMQQHDLQNGLTRDEMIHTIRTLLSGVGTPEDFHEEQARKEAKQQQLEERARQKLEKAKSTKSTDQKRAEREEKRNKKRNR